MSKHTIEVGAANGQLNIRGISIKAEVVIRPGNSCYYCDKKLSEIESKLQAVVDEYFPDAVGCFIDEREFYRLCKQTGLKP